MLSRTAIGLVLTLLGAHVVLTLASTVNIPLEDDWDLLLHGLGPRLDLGWLLRPHNEHPVVPTRLITWGLYRLDGWNLSVSHALNVGLLAALVLANVILLRRVTRDHAPWLPFAAAAFLLQADVATNVLWAIQSSFLMMSLLTTLAVLFLFHERRSVPSLLTGTLCSIVACWSLAAGLATATAICVTFALAETRGDATTQAPMRQTAFRVGVVITAHVLTFAAWLATYSGTAGALQHAGSISSGHWIYYSELVASGFGQRSVSSGWATVLTGVAVLPFAMWLIASRLRMRPSEWALVAAWLASASVLAAITAGRASLGVLEWSKSPRYVQVAALLVPPTLGLWHLVLREAGTGLRRMMWLVLTGILAGASAQAWNLPSRYREVHDRLQAGAACVARQPGRAGVPVSCPTVYPRDLQTHVAAARHLRLSFTREARSP